MSSGEPARVRREPPLFRRVEVTRTEPLAPRMVLVTLFGTELDGLVVDEPAASVRLLLPPSGHDDVVMPEWDGNQFLLADGSRPVIRTLTPLRVDAAAMELDVAVVVHGPGAASTWAATAEPGRPAAVSGPGRGYAVDADAPAYMVAGDETAIPAITQLLARIPASTPVQVIIEISEDFGRVTLPAHPEADVGWRPRGPGDEPGDSLVEAIATVELTDGIRVWVAGEAAAMQRIRRHLTTDRALAPAQMSVRGYWKHGRRGDD